jgi:hypothetical protein
MYVCGVPIMELSRVVVLASRPVKGNTVSQLIEKSNFITERIHLDGQGRCYRCSRQDPKAAYGKVLLGCMAAYS